MNNTSPLAHAALISFSSPGTDQFQPRILGRSLAERQVEYAASAGCTKIVLLGGGGRALAIAARLRAEEMGLKVQEISGPHSLATCIAPDQRLLVLQSDLLPSHVPWEMVDISSGHILTLPAGAANDLGFERIDLARNWAGALIVSGKVLAGLLELPEDSETSPAILRLALQAHLPESQLDNQYLTNGGWSLIGAGSDLKMAEDRWLSFNMKPETSAPASVALVQRMLRRFGTGLLDRPVLAPVLLAIGLCLLIGAGALAWLGHGAWAFGVVTIAALTMESAIGLRRLLILPLTRLGQWPRSRLLIDLAIFLCAVISIEGQWYRQAFAPLVLIAAFHSGPRVETGWKQALRDRAIISGTIAIFAAFAPVEPAVMVVAAALLMLNIRWNGKNS